MLSVHHSRGFNAFKFKVSGFGEGGLLYFPFVHLISGHLSARARVSDRASSITRAQKGKLGNSPKLYLFWRKYEKRDRKQKQQEHQEEEQEVVVVAAVAACGLALGPLLAPTSLGFRVKGLLVRAKGRAEEVDPSNNPYRSV